MIIRVANPGPLARSCRPVFTSRELKVRALAAQNNFQKYRDGLDDARLAELRKQLEGENGVTHLAKRSWNLFEPIADNCGVNLSESADREVIARYAGISLASAILARLRRRYRNRSDHGQK